MYPDGFSLRPVLREMAGELAGHGYSVLATNLFCCTRAPRRSTFPNTSGKKPVPRFSPS